MHFVLWHLGDQNKDDCKSTKLSGQAVMHSLPEADWCHGVRQICLLLYILNFSLIAVKILRKTISLSRDVRPPVPGQDSIQQLWHSVHADGQLA